MKCLVTGATGFLGTNIVHQLVKQGWDVRASGMHGSETKYIQDLPIEIVFADITNLQEVDALISGCDIVFHVAADTSFWKRNYQRQRTINVEGTLNVAKACIKQGVRRLVYTSTLDVLGYDPEGGVIDETTGKFNFTNIGYNYGETKHEAEEKLKAFDDQLDIVYIYPGFMVGPYDYTLQLGRVFFELKEGKMPGFPAGGGSFCHVEDVAKAHVSAATKGRKGEGYICAGNTSTNLPYQSVFKAMADTVDAKAPKLVIPRFIMVLYGHICELLSTFTNKPPEVNPGIAHYISLPQYAISDKAVEELGYTVQPVQQCIDDALQWYRDNGYKL